jgi:hypothetical protein
MTMNRGSSIRRRILKARTQWRTKSTENENSRTTKYGPQQKVDESEKKKR